MLFLCALCELCGEIMYLLGFGCSHFSALFQNFCKIKQEIEEGHLKKYIVEDTFMALIQAF